MSNKLLADQQRFIGDIASMLVPSGVPATAARLYGYLLLRPEPVSLDRITADLGMSKSSASVAARLLEQYGLARRHGERGSKRALYDVSDNYEGMLTGQNRLLDGLAARLKEAGTDAAGPARERLLEMSRFYVVIREAMDAALLRWREERPGAAAARALSGKEN
ncbi:GbsR/MarR family transcriptional regulator [Rhizobiaceae sp. 2RAB30]